MDLDRDRLQRVCGAGIFPCTAVWVYVNQFPVAVRSSMSMHFLGSQFRLLPQLSFSLKMPIGHLLTNLHLLAKQLALNFPGTPLELVNLVPETPILLPPQPVLELSFESSLFNPAKKSSNQRAK